MPVTSPMDRLLLQKRICRYNNPSIQCTYYSPLQQTFLDTFVCQANTNGTEYYFFEAFDEVWKLEEFGGVEGYWGLFYSK